MIKIIGAMLIMASGTLFGFYQAAKYVERPRQLRILIHALLRLETEIKYGQTPLPDAFLKTALVTEAPINKIFTTTAEALNGDEELALHEAWQKALDQCWNDTSLQVKERDVLSRMGTVLGMSDSDDQRKHLQLAQLQLKSEEQVAREEQIRYEKMWNSLGVLVAVLIVILMV